VVTNKTLSPQKVVAFHEGRGSQEGIFAELKTHCQMGYVPILFGSIIAQGLSDAKQAPACR